jgi:hypothetical protein
MFGSLVSVQHRNCEEAFTANFTRIFDRRIVKSEMNIEILLSVEELRTKLAAVSLRWFRAKIQKINLNFFVL